MDIATVIYNKLKSKGMSVEEFAEQVGIARSTMYRIVQGKTDPEEMSVSRFLAIAHGLGISGEELLTGRPYEPPSAIERRYRSLEPEGRALVRIALEAAEARQSEKESLAEIVSGA